MDCYVAYCIGFFAADMAMMFVHPRVLFSWSMFVHHFMGVFCFPLALIYGPASYFITFVLLTEGSTPFMHLRRLLSIFGHRHSRMYTINGIVILVVFFVLRVATQPYIFARILLTEEDLAGIPVVVRHLVDACLVAGMVLNVFWFSLIAKGALKVLRAGPHAPHDD